MNDCGIEGVRGSRVLEIGSKNALFLRCCMDRGIEAVGTEIVPERVESMRRTYPNLQIVQNTEDSLPVESNSFDYVVSFQVLEHMSNLKQMLHECVRVLKPGGCMYHICPNYKSFYEGHYRVVWWPFLRKRAGELYLRLIGRNPKYLVPQYFQLRRLA